MIQYLFNMSWLAKSIVAMFLIIPMVLIIEFFKNNYGAKFEGVIFAWYSAVLLGVCYFSLNKIGGMDLKNLYQPLWPLFFVFLVGILLGTLAITLTVSAMFDQSVSNSALPYAIFGANPAVAYLIIAGLGVLMPRFFPLVTFSWVNFLGIFFMVVGMGMLVWKNS